MPVEDMERVVQHALASNGGGLQVRPDDLPHLEGGVLTRSDQGCVVHVQTCDMFGVRVDGSGSWWMGTRTGVRERGGRGERAGER